MSTIQGSPSRVYAKKAEKLAVTDAEANALQDAENHVQATHKAFSTAVKTTRREACIAYLEAVHRRDTLRDELMERIEVEEEEEDADD